jgi:MFS family permease
MKKRPLLQLFFVNFVIFLTGMGLLPLLPLYAKGFGASDTDIGFYMAVTYAAITAGTTLTDRLSRLLAHRTLFISAGILGVPALFLLGQATGFWQVILLTAVVWFTGGIGIALVSVFTGQVAKSNSRGKAFSLTFLALPLASLVAGLTIGRLAEWQGYPFMFAMLALAWAAWPVVAFFGLENNPISRSSKTVESGLQRRGGFGKGFYFLLIATLLSATTIYLMRLGTSLSMHSLDFSPNAISSTSAIGGLVTIPVTYFIGTMSDKLGRKLFLTAGYLLGATGVLVLATATQLWQFWLATALLFGALSANGAVAPALATDLLSKEARSHALPYLSSMRNVAGIIGFATGGLLIDKAEPNSLYIIAGAVAVAAVFFLSQVGSGQRSESQKPATMIKPSIPLSPDRAT